LHEFIHPAESAPTEKPEKRPNPTAANVPSAAKTTPI